MEGAASPELPSEEPLPPPLGACFLVCQVSCNCQKMSHPDLVGPLSSLVQLQFFCFSSPSHSLSSLFQFFLCPGLPEPSCNPQQEEALNTWHHLGLGCYEPRLQCPGHSSMPRAGHSAARRLHGQHLLSATPWTWSCQAGSLKQRWVDCQTLHQRGFSSLQISLLPDTAIL